jgi:hypothetical protein
LRGKCCAKRKRKGTIHKIKKNKMKNKPFKKSGRKEENKMKTYPPRTGE